MKCQWTALIAALLYGQTALAGYTQPITFQVNKWETKHRDRDIQKLYILLDQEGGRNPVYRAQEMQANHDRTVFTYSTSLAEGNYFYVFIPDLHLVYSDVTDLNNNPDDAPEGDYFQDPHPRAPGSCGPYSTDSCLTIINPDRAAFDITTFAPAANEIVTASTVTIQAEVSLGDSTSPFDTSSAQVHVELDQPSGVYYSADIDPPVLGWSVLPAAFTAVNSTKGIVSATWDNLNEGLHRVQMSIRNQDGLESVPFETYIFVNRDNQAPLADAGPMKFGVVNQPVMIDGGDSYDPDWIGISSYDWRVVSGPGGAVTRFDAYNEEQGSAECNGSQPMASLSQSIVPRFVTNVAGDYVLGLTLTDSQGVSSQESQVEVRIVSSFSDSVQTRIVVDHELDQLVIDASLSTGASTAEFIADAKNPAPLSLSTNGLVATAPVPADGVYLVHVLVGNGWPHVAMIHVDQGQASGIDLVKPPKEFWEDEAVIYLAYVREYHDSDGDGEGDFAGMINRMDHMVDLGINALWLMPPLQGPTPHGYGMTGHFGTPPDYGTLQQYEELVQAAHDKGIRVIFDFVGNHTITDHPFFVMASSHNDSPMREFYAYQTNGYFRHLGEYLSFPDVNTNSGLVRKLFTDQAKFWMERGVDAFRYDLADCQPTSLWQQMRRTIKAKRPNAIILPESHPAKPRHFEHSCDMAYDSEAYEGFLHSLALQDWGLGNFDHMLGEYVYDYVADNDWLNNFMVDGDIFQMRYYGNQDKFRFLRNANYKVGRLKVAASILLTLPGTPLLYYGDETGVVVKRGRMKLDNLSTEEQELLDLHRRLLLIRQNNAGLRTPDYAAQGAEKNSYFRLNSDSDPGGEHGMAYIRHGASQRFLVVAYRRKASPLGTEVRFWPPASHFENFPASVVLVDHLKPSVQTTVSLGTLTATSGYVQRLRDYEVKLLQVTRAGIPDADGDAVLDSYDTCLDLSNPQQLDSDRDGVGNACDACPNSTISARVDIAGCSVTAGSGVATRRFALEGELDDTGYNLVDNGGVTLSASFNGRELYLATPAAAVGQDVCLLVSADTGATAAAPLGKRGQVAYAGIALCDEGDNDDWSWVGATGQTRGATLERPGKGFVEGTINLLEEYGSVPDRIYVAVVQYGANDVQQQAPAATTEDNNITADEFFELALTVQVPDAGMPDRTSLVDAAVQPDRTVEIDGSVLPDSDPGVDTSVVGHDAATADRGVDAGGFDGSGSDAMRPDAGGADGAPRPDRYIAPHQDADEDGVENIVDNCPHTANAGQEDYDLDGYGDLCDSCPISMPGAVVDALGCALDDPSPGSNPGNRPTPRKVSQEPDPVEPQVEGCGCSSAAATGGSYWLLAVICGVLWRRMRLR